MKVKAISSFTAFTDQMNVFNTGDVGELPDAMAEQYIEAGLAAAAKGSDAKAAAAKGSDAPSSPVADPAGDAPA